MVQPLSTSTSESTIPPSARPSRVASAVVASAAAFVALLLVSAIGLWAHYGTAVFFEMIKTGIAACM
jgi:uncharacterized membrane protein (DUF2068 family)